MAASPGGALGSLDDGQAYKSETDMKQDPSSRVSAVLTCSGNLTDPDFNEKCNSLFERLQNVLCNDEINVVKCEPWNSVKITFDLPTEAAQRLSELAELARRGDDTTLRQLGILSLQLQGGQIISMTLADGSNTSALSSSSRTSHSSSTSRVESTAVKNEERDVPSAVSSRLPASTAISVVSSRTDGSSPHSLSPSSSSPSSSSSTSSSIAASTSHMKRTSSGLHASAAHQRTSPKTNRGSGSSSSNSSLLVDLLQKESGKTERDSSPPEKKRRKYSSQGGAAHSDVESYPSVTKVANAMMAGHHSANGPTSLSGSEKLLAERLASAKQAGTTLIPPKSEGSSSSGKNDRAKGSHNQYGTRQTDFDAVSSFSKSSKSAGLSISRTGNSHHNTQIHSEHSIQDSVSDDKKCLDAKSANSGRGSLSSSMMPPPPKLKSISSNSCSSDSSAASSISSHAAGGNSDKHSSVQHPAIVGASGVGRDNQVQPQNLLNNATDLLQSKRDQQHQILSRVASSKSRQVLINPNTGMMESGPSESSSEGENDLDGSGTSAGATGDKRKSGGVFSTISGSGFAKNQHSSNSSSNAERALKVKLKLPSSSQQQNSQQPGENSVSSPLNVNNAVNNVSSSKQLDTPHNSDNKKRAIEPISEHSNTNSSGSERVGSLSEAKTKAVEPKLPKLILSVREKKVKLAQESAAAASSKPQGTSLPHSLSSFKTIGDRKKARKLTTSDDEGSESEDIEDDDGGDDYHPTDEEEEEEEEDVEDEDLDEPDLDDDDDEALEIATARAKNLRMMQLHTSSSSPSRATSKSSLGSGDSLHNVLDKESSRDSKVQNRTTGLSQASEKHLKSLETSRSKFLRMKQQQKNKKQTMQLNQTPKIDLWKDSLNIKDRKFNEHVKDLIDKKGNISKLSNAKTEDKHSQEIEGRLSLNIREAKEDAQMAKGLYSLLNKDDTLVYSSTASEMGNTLDGLPEKGALGNISGDTKSSDCKSSKSPSDYGMSPHISEKPDSIDPRRSTKGDSPMGEDPIRQLLYSNSKTSASSSSGSSTSSTSSTADKQDMQIDPSEQNNRGNTNERTDVTASDPISALSLPQRDIDSRDNHQQGEDSGIESMDTLSEKSPNQGDDPFPNQEKLDRELKDISTPLPSISSPNHMNTLSSTSPPRNNSKMSIHMPQSKTIINQATILSEGIHHPQQEESANIRKNSKDIAENNPLKIEVAITSTSKSEAVHVPINVVEQDNVIVEGKKESKTLLKDTVFNEVVVKEEESKPINELPISVSNDKDDVIEMFPEATVKSEIPQSKEEDLASKQSTKETTGEETLPNNERIDNLDSSNEDTQKDTENDTNGDGESTTTNVESLPATSTSECKVTSDAKSTDRKVEAETMEDTKAKKDSSDSCDVAINDTKDPSGNKPSPIVGSVQLAHPVSSGCSSQIQSKEEPSVESRKKAASLEPILENKSPTVVVEEKVLPSPKSGDTNKKGDAGSSEMAGNSSNVNLTSNSTHSSVSVSLIRLPVASDAKKDKISDKKQKESATVDANSSSKTISLASVVATSIEPTNNGVAVTASNGLTTQEEHERSSSSTPEIPMLTSNIELANPSTVANCITLHSAASAMARTSSPILTNGSTGGGIQVHRAGGLNNIPPGAKMVPVKLVSVPGGDGNMPGMRLVRVSPVKSHPSMHQGHQGGITVDGNTLGSVPGTRTVVIKSSMLKSATTAAMAQQAAAHQNATIISTAASNCPSITLPSISTPHQASTVLSAGSASSFSITPNPSPLPPHIVTSQPLSPSLLVNASQNAISAMPPANVLKAVSTSTPPQTPPINNVSEPHLPTATFSISNHHNSSTTVELIPNSGLNPTNLPVHPPNLPISVSLARRSISASVVPVPAMNTISSVAASSSGVTTLLGPSLSITPVEVGNQAGLANNAMPSSKHKSIVEPSKPSPAILNSVLASIGASRSPDPSPMIVTGVSRNHMIGTTVIENPVLVKSPTDIPCVVQTPAAAVTVSLKPKITEALKIDTKVKGQGNQRNPRTTKSPQRHHSNGDDFGGGGSLLRPLLQKEEVMPATVITTHVEVSSASAMTINTSTSASQKGKRRRRHDTGSSTKSDKSDNSVTDPVASASKKSKLTAADAKKSQQHNNSSPAVSPASNKGQAASGSSSNTPKTAAKNPRAGRAKKDEGQMKELEKAVVTTETTKQAVQTPAKKNARGSSNSSTDSLPKSSPAAKNAKSNAQKDVTSKGSSPASSASPSPSRTRKSTTDDPSSEQSTKAAITNQETNASNNAKERRSARQQTAALAAAADKNQTVTVSAQPTANGGNKTSKIESAGVESATAAPSTSTKAASNRTRRGAEDNINSTVQNSVASTPSGMSPAQTRNRKATEETTNASTNGKSNPGRTTRKSVANDTSSSSSPADLTTSSTAPSNNSAAGNGSNNNTVSTGANGSTVAGNKEDTGAAGKTNTPTEEQRTMKTRSAK